MDEHDLLAADFERDAEPPKVKKPLWRRAVPPAIAAVAAGVWYFTKGRPPSPVTYVSYAALLIAAAVAGHWVTATFWKRSLRYFVAFACVFWAMALWFPSDTYELREEHSDGTLVVSLHKRLLGGGISQTVYRPVEERPPSGQRQVYMSGPLSRMGDRHGEWTVYPPGEDPQRCWFWYGDKVSESKFNTLSGPTRRRLSAPGP